MSEAKAKKFYIAANGDESRSASADAQVLRFAFSDGTNLEVDPAKLPESIRRCAMFHGLAQKIGDSYAATKSVEEAAENAMALYERLEAGEWVGERESAGPRISLVLLAIVRVKEQAGQPLDEAGIAERAAKLKADKAFRDGAMANPAVKAAFAAIQAERAAERAAEAAKAAGAAPVDTATL